MKSLLLTLTAILGLATLTPRALQTPSACGMQLGTSAPAFCDTFDQPAPINSRAGQLDSVIWGVSREIGVGGNNFGQGTYNQWPSTTLQACDGSTPIVNPPFDVIICSGQLREASNDNLTRQFDAGDVTVLAIYPKQPFDFAGRTGTVSFDVSNDTHGSHAAWPEFWLTDLPVPAPFTKGGWKSVSQHGLGIRFGASVGAGQQGACPNANNLTSRRWTVDSLSVIRNYVIEDTQIGSNASGMALTMLDCVTSPTSVGQMNHVEVRLSQAQIDVYASDAGTQTPLKHIATVTQANLSLTRGLIWLEDVHYNADKGDAPTQREHTFAWDNVAFDGPFTYRDLSYDAPDALTPSSFGSVNLGKHAGANQLSPWSVPGLPASPSAQAVRVLFNFFHNNPPTTVNVVVNGHAHSVAWPFPDTQDVTARTMAVTIPITDLVAGTNSVQIGGDLDLIVFNVNIVLVNVTVAPPPSVSVVITPKTVGLSAGASQQFACTVTGSMNPACAWSVTEGVAGGVVSNAGLYSAPNAAGVFHVKAMSVADPSKSDTATATVSAPQCPVGYPRGQPIALVTNGNIQFSTLCTP